MDPIPKHGDERGFLIEFLREDENILNFNGQIYAATMQPGDIRGNHYHNEKTEIFCALRGKLKIRIQSIKGGEIEEHMLDSTETQIQRVKVLPGFAHQLINYGDNEAVLLAYGDHIHDHSNPDQHHFEIL